MSSYKKYFPSKTSFSLRQNHFRVLRVATASRGFGWINRISFVIEWNMTSEPHFSQKLSADWMPRNHVTKYCKGSLEVSNTLLCRGLRMLGRAGSAKHTDSHCVNIQWHKLELLTPENAPHDFTTPKQIYPRGPAVAYRPLAPSQSIHFYTYTVHCTTALSFKARSSHWGPLTGPTAKFFAAFFPSIWPDVYQPHSCYRRRNVNQNFLWDQATCPSLHWGAGSHHIRAFSCSTSLTLLEMQGTSWRRPRAAVGSEMDKGKGESERQDKEGSQWPAGGIAG